MKAKIVSIREFKAMRAIGAETGSAMRISRDFALINLPSDREERARAIRQARIEVALHNSGPETYATCGSACLLYGITLPDAPEDIELVVRTPHSRRKTIIGAYVANIAPTTVTRRARNLPDTAVTEHRGYPVLTPPYVVMELLAQAKPERALIQADAATAHFCGASNFKRADTVKRFKAMLKELERISGEEPYSRTYRLLRQRIGHVSPWAQSPAETRLRLALFRAGVPQPVEQFPFPMNDTNGFVDFAWPDLKIGFEIDGTSKYASRDDLVNEKRREQVARKYLPNFYRWMWSDLRDADLTERIRSVFPATELVRPRRVE